jgi:signal transduction histidine kinase
MGLRERVDYSRGLLVVSGLLLFAPLFDMWRDAGVEGKSVLSTVLENSIFLSLALLLIGLGTWLRYNDWEERYVQLVARWSIAGCGAVALVFGWVLALQLFVQSDLKPYVVVGNGAVIGGVVLFVAGVYHARSRMENAARAVERDRVAALFENTADAVVAVAFEDDSAVIVEANDSFEAILTSDGDTLVGRPVVEVLTDAAAAPVDEPAGGSQVGRLREVVGDPTTEVELRVGVGGDVRDFIVAYVPVGEPSGVEDGAAGFLIFTDITAQKNRGRQFERLGEGTEDLLGARSVDDVLGVVRAITADLLDDALVGIWTYDRKADAYRPRQPMVANGGDRIVELPALPASGATDESGRDAATDEGSNPAFDGDRLRTALEDRGYAASTMSVRRLTDQSYLVTARKAGAVPTTERHLLDLLVANARAVVQRVDREGQLTRRNDQLEFANSLLRHDIQNSMTIIRARGEALVDATDGREADYARTVVNQSDDVSSLVDRFRRILAVLTDDELDVKPVALGPLVENRVRVARSTHPDATVRSSVPDEVSVRADEMLENVVGNLVRNAIEHNDTDSPTVEVSVVEHERVVTLTVADDGPGVPDDEKEVVFRRGNRGLKGADIGSGFGLFLVDTLVDGYGGSVTVRDNEPRGAVFVVRLPKADDEADDPEG